MTARRPGDETSAPLFMQADVARDSTLSDVSSEWPLVLLSHGTGGSAGSLSWLADRLARAGHVCIGVDHHGNTVTEPYRAEGFLCWWERALDLSFVLDRLDELPGLGLRGRVDRGRVGVVGFSLGGHTALALAGAVTSMDRFERWRSSSVMVAATGPREFPDLAAELSRLKTSSATFRRSWERHGESFADARVSRCVAVAPAPPVRAFTPRSLGDVTRPVLLLAGEADTEAPYEECAVWLSRTNPNFALRSMGEQVGHYTFLPECTAHGRDVEPTLCRDRPGVVRARVHDEAASRIRAFLVAEEVSGAV